MRNVEIIQTGAGEERLEVMSNVKSGVKMATAVSAYKYENNGYESLGKLGLAIIGKKESNCYQLLLYRGKQSVVTVANISPRFNLKVQQDNYANFTDEANKIWTVCFDSQDVMINFSKQILLCKAMFSKDGVCHCDLILGEGRGVELGDSLEIQMTSWMVDTQSLGRMIETSRNKDKGVRFKIGGRNQFSGMENCLIGMKKGGRRFIIAPSDHGRTAFDVEITKVKPVENKERRVPIDVAGTDNDIIDRMAKIGQPVMNGRNKTNETPMEMPELEEVSPRNVSEEVSHVSAFSTPRSARRGSNQDPNIRTTPIPIIRSDSPASQRSCQSTGAPVRVVAQPPVFSQQVSVGPEFNMMMTESRLQNTEMRMNIQRISDKMDSILNVHSPNKNNVNVNTLQNDEIMGKLDSILEQNKEMKTLLDKHKPNIAEENKIKQQKLQDQAEMLQRLEQKLKEKEQQLFKELSNKQETIRALEQKLEEQMILTENIQIAARGQLQGEVRKLLSSTGKLLLNQFSQDEVYSGDNVRDTITHTFTLIGDKLMEKYGAAETSSASETRRHDTSTLPIAAVAPVPAEVEEWDAESDE